MQKKRKNGELHVYAPKDEVIEDQGPELTVSQLSSTISGVKKTKNQGINMQPRFGKKGKFILTKSIGLSDLNDFYPKIYTQKSQENAGGYQHHLVKLSTQNFHSRVEISLPRLQLMQSLKTQFHQSKDDIYDSSLGLAAHSNDLRNQSSQIQINDELQAMRSSIDNQITEAASSQIRNNPKFRVHKVSKEDSSKLLDKYKQNLKISSRQTLNGWRGDQQQGKAQTLQNPKFCTAQEKQLDGVEKEILIGMISSQLLHSKENQDRGKIMEKVRTAVAPKLNSLPFSQRSDRTDTFLKNFFTKTQGHFGQHFDDLNAFGRIEASGNRQTPVSNKHIDIFDLNSRGSKTDRQIQEKFGLNFVESKQEQTTPSGRRSPESISRSSSQLSKLKSFRNGIEPLQPLVLKLQKLDSIDKSDSGITRPADQQFSPLKSPVQKSLYSTGSFKTIRSVSKAQKLALQASSKFKKSIKRRKINSQDDDIWKYQGKPKKKKNKYLITNFKKINNDGLLGDCNFDEKEEQTLKFVHPPLYHSLTKFIFDENDVWNQEIKSKVQEKMKTAVLSVEQGDETPKTKIYEKISMQKKMRKEQILRSLHQFLSKLSKLKLTTDDIMGKKVFSTLSYEREGSKVFIDACKYNDERTVFIMLRREKFLVYDFDHIKMTGLHWACKRGFERIARMLVENNTDLEAQDMLERTPLYFALQGQHRSLAIYLLSKDVNPFTPSTKYNYYDLCQSDQYLRTVIHECRLVDMKICLGNVKNKSQAKAEWKHMLFGSDNQKIQNGKDGLHKKVQW